MADKQSREVKAALHERETVIPRKEADKLRGLTVSVDVDVSEALTGLKALQREARKATQALAELEAQYKPRIEAANDLLRIQGADGNWNYDAYMHGMYNGMEIILATIEGRGPSFRDKPTEFLSDKDLSSVPTCELQRELETREGVKTFKLPHPGSHANLRIATVNEGFTEFIEGPAIVTVSID